MVVCRRIGCRRGATVVEFAIVAPVVLLFILTQIVGGLGISRFQEVAHLARSCARYAATHGGTYIRDGIDKSTGVPAVSSAEDLRAYIASRAALLDPNKIEIEISWTSPSTLSPRNMPTYMDTDPNLIPPGQVVIRNNVIVTLKYPWAPEAYLKRAITLTSTSKMPMSY